MRRPCYPSMTPRAGQLMPGFSSVGCAGAVVFCLLPSTVTRVSSTPVRAPSSGACVPPTEEASRLGAMLPAESNGFPAQNESLSGQKDASGGAVASGAVRQKVPAVVARARPPGEEQMVHRRVGYPDPGGQRHTGEPEQACPAPGDQRGQQDPAAYHGHRLARAWGRGAVLADLGAGRHWRWALAAPAGRGLPCRNTPEGRE